METAAEDGTSVLFSSHVVAELERVADYLVVLTGGRVQVAGDVEDLLTGHQILTGPSAGSRTVGGAFDVVHAQLGLAQAHLLVRRRTAGQPQPPDGWQAHPVDAGGTHARLPARAGSVALPGPELGRGGDLMTALTSGARQADRWRLPLQASVTSMAWAVWRQHRVGSDLARRPAARVRRDDARGRDRAAPALRRRDPARLPGLVGLVGTSAGRCRTRSASAGRRPTRTWSSWPCRRSR